MSFRHLPILADDLKDCREWDEAPLIDEFRVGVDYTPVREALDLLWDLDAEIFRYDSNAVLFYSALLIRNQSYAKAEAILEKLRHYFVLNPFLLNNLAVAKSQLGKKAEAKQLIDKIHIQTCRRVKVLIHNYETLFSQLDRELQLFYVKPKVGDTSSVNPDRDFGKLDEIIDELLLCPKIEGQGKIFRKGENKEFGNSPLIHGTSYQNEAVLHSPIPGSKDVVGANP